MNKKLVMFLSVPLLKYSRMEINLGSQTHYSIQLMNVDELLMILHFEECTTNYVNVRGSLDSNGMLQSRDWRIRKGL